MHFLTQHDVCTACATSVHDIDFESKKVRITDSLPYSIPGAEYAEQDGSLDNLPIYDRVSRSSDDALFWLTATGILLENLISYGGYSSDEQRKTLEFYRNFIVPSLGPKPTSAGHPATWKSFMTDDFTPLEFSWNWGSGNELPERRIRFSIEAIGYQAGTSIDPWNMTSTLQLLQRLGRGMTRLDLQWFDQLVGKLLPYPDSRRSGVPELSPVQASISTMFLAFELGKGEPLVKVYMMPKARSLVSKRPSQQLLIDTMQQFAQDTEWKSLGELSKDLRKWTETKFLDPFMIAFDCVAPTRSRMKIYVRSSDTSFASVKNIMSLYEDSSTIANGLEELRRLWEILFVKDEPFDPTRQLPPVEHETSGILFYIEAHPASRHKNVKVYLPVKHYANNDWSTAQGLASFIRQRNACQSGLADSYLGALTEACRHRNLKEKRGLQTYIACKIENNSLSITSYLSPDIYAQMERDMRHHTC
ncbi:MAG: hypothetical protein Q9165_007444 [Trypethelium subeluteriae]